MPDILGSYLKYAKGESGSFSVWSLLNITGVIIEPFIAARNALYDRGVFCSMDPPVPVISVGNLCSGGTNKTPMVDMLARRLSDDGFSVGIVSRGYGGRIRKPMCVGTNNASSDRSLTGDEPLMLANRLPDVKVVVSRDRYEGVQFLKELDVNVVVADDAFQHRRMGRDMEIVLIDATCPFGNGKLFPAGILREKPDALSRADVVILTKTELAGTEVGKIKNKLARWVSPDAIFTARVEIESWMELTDAGLREYKSKPGSSVPQGRFVSFSAIGNPQSFYKSLISLGLDVVKNRAFRDHHRFSWYDIDNLDRTVHKLGATGLVCTEKDLWNMPNDLSLIYPLFIPRISIAIDDEAGFWRAITRRLKPELVVASNGYGEDAIGSLLAEKLQDRFPVAGISAFSLVGEGREYKNRGIKVISPESDMPSAGIIKYSIRALMKDFRHGLRKVIKKQIEEWRKQKGRFRTPICVGDVYLLAHTLWGQGMSPALIATAKSVKLSGHWMPERALMKRRARRVWARDGETARNLCRSRIDAVFSGNPIMDLAAEFNDTDDPWEGIPSPRVMLLPGSRPRAYQDAGMLLDAVKLISEKMECGFVMVIAPTLDADTLLSGSDYRFRGGALKVGSASVAVYKGSIADAARGADLLIGFGGTANQVSAGLGVPVVSILERGKLVQKKLLGDAEVLTHPDAQALAAKTVELLSDRAALDKMSRAGINAMGGSGALSDVVGYAAGDLGLDARCKLFTTLRDIWLRGGSPGNIQCEDETEEDGSREEEHKWKMPEQLASKMMQSAKIIK